jgi:hypothetical protein
MALLLFSRARESRGTLARAGGGHGTRRCLFEAVNANAHSDRGFIALSSPLLAMHINVQVLQQLIGARAKALIKSGYRTYRKAWILCVRLEPPGDASLGLPVVL